MKEKSTIPKRSLLRDNVLRDNVGRLAAGLLVCAAPALLFGPPTLAQPPAAPPAGGSPGAPNPSVSSDLEPKKKRSNKITFNLEDADLPELVKFMAEITGRRFILPAKTRSIKATVYSPAPISVNEAYNAFLSVLETHGLTVVSAGRFYKIVESQGVQQRATPMYTGNEPSPGSDRFVTRLHRLGNVAVDDIVTLLERFRSPEGNVSAYGPTNTLILTDTGRQIRRMLRIIEAVDVPRTGEQIWIEKIHYANASEIAEQLSKIFPGATVSSAPSRPSPAARGDSPNARPASIGKSKGKGESRITNIFPDERTNSLIIMATERAYMRIIEIIRELDKPMDGGGKVHVHHLQHGDAQEIASALSALTSGGGASKPRPGGAGGGAAAPATASLFEGTVQVSAYEPGNALIITASTHDYAALRQLIDELDAPRWQVFIEAAIMELEVRDTDRFGLSFHGGIPDAVEEGSLAVFGMDALSTLLLGAGAGATTGGAAGVGGAASLGTLSSRSEGGLFGLRGPTVEGSQQAIGISVPAFGVLIDALATSGDANVLSTPHIMTRDNVQAEITVGQNVPLQTNSVGIPGFGGGIPGLPGGAQGGNAVNGFGSLPRQDVGTTLRITPHVNEASDIRLEIEEEISEVGASGQGALGAVTINQRSAKTEVVVADQQTIVIGGLMRDQVSNSQTKIPILGDIPLLGVLFRRSSSTKQKVNLLLVLTPYIIRDQADLRSIYERKMRERQEFIDRHFVFGVDSYDPAVDYSRTRGPLAALFNEMDIASEERALKEALEAGKPPEHVAGQPIGSAGTGDAPSSDRVITPDSDPEGIPDQDGPGDAIDETRQVEVEPLVD